MSARRAFLADVRAALPGWIAAHALVVIGWTASLLWIEHFRRGVRPDSSTQGLFAWDGAFYRSIAEVGYEQVGREGARFFPLFPLAGRALGAMVATPGFWLLVLSNAGALLAGALMHRLCRFEGLGAPAASRAATLVAILPPAFVFVWGYAESLLLVLAIATFLALRRKRWWLAALFGALAALARPTGVLLVLPALIEACRGRRGWRDRELPGRAAAVAAPVAGAVAFLWWVGATFGDWRIPIDVQDELRGGAVNPFVRLLEAGIDFATFDVHGLHFPFAVAMLGLCFVTARRLPASYAVFATALVVVSLSARNLNSIERYGLDAFPLVIALALIASSRPRANVTMIVSSLGFVALTTMAWLQDYVP
ncbi:MAG: mannosyltransferase family protein [Acidimicrobiales bacterium]